MNQQVGAIVTSGDYSGLALLRTLASKGIPIVLIDHEFSIGITSKYKKRFFKSPPPSNVDAYFYFLIDLIKKEHLEGWVIFPISDEIVYVLSRYHDILNQYIKVTVPEFGIVKNVYNKKFTYQQAEKIGIPIPKTFYPKTLSALLKENLHYPLVIKPAIKDHFYSKIKKKAIKVNNHQELLDGYTEMNSIINSSEILVQEFLDGGPQNLYSFCPFIKNNKVITSITARRTRQHPMDFGHATTFAETVNIPILEKLATNFLNTINYNGICEVEFMYDEKANNYKLIEVNPRVWGWHSLAIAAGIDLPYLLFQDITGKEIHKIPNPRNLKWIRLTTDTLTVLQEIWRGNLKYSDYRESLKGDKEFAVFSLKDPIPFFAELALLPYLWIKRGF